MEQVLYIIIGINSFIILVGIIGIIYWLYTRKREREAMQRE